MLLCTLLLAVEGLTGCACCSECKKCAQNIAGHCQHAHVACRSGCSVAPGKTVGEYIEPFLTRKVLHPTVEAQQALVGESARLILELAEVSPAAGCWVTAPAIRRLLMPLPLLAGRCLCC